MKVKEISNFYFFKIQTGYYSELLSKGEYSQSTFLLVGTANFPSEPRPAIEPATDSYGFKNYERGVDFGATRTKQSNAATKFVSKNNVYRCQMDEITGEEHEYSWNIRRKNTLNWYRIHNPSTQSRRPLKIGERKTGPGNYFFFGQSLYLADSEEDVINHTTQSEPNQSHSNLERKGISDETQIFVWNRDGGSCVKCESRENIAFDHIIPHSLGGSNSRRNLQLLCDSCNLKKSNKIGG